MRNLSWFLNELLLSASLMRQEDCISTLPCSLQSSPAAAAPPCCGPELSGLVLQGKTSCCCYLYRARVRRFSWNPGNKLGLTFPFAAPGNARRISRSVIAAASRGQDMQVNAAHILFTGPDAAKTADDILSQASRMPQECF